MNLFYLQQTQADVHNARPFDSQSQISDWDVTSIDRWKQPGAARSVTSSMNNFLDSMDAVSTRSQTLDEQPKDLEIKSETPRHSSKHFVNKDLTANKDTESNKLPGDSDVDIDRDGRRSTPVDQDEVTVISSNKASPSISDNNDTTLKTQRKRLSDTSSNTETEAITELSQEDGSVVC